jgi:hypothetical protein
MKSLFIVILICIFFLIGCNPEIDRRAARYNKEDCPVCDVSGKCRTCTGSGKCTFCGGAGKRISSTKNYTGEGVNLIDYEEDCPFCNESGICSHCKGEKICNACNGTHKVDINWSFFKGNN